MEDGGAKRITVSAIAAALVLGTIGGVAQRSAGYAFQASGGDAWAYRSMVSAMDKAAHLLTSPLFIIVASAAAGAAIYSWVDFIVRKWLERWKQTERLSFAALDRKLFAMTLMLIFGGGFALSVLWVAGERFLVKRPITAANTAKVTILSEEGRAAIIAPFQEQIDALKRQIASTPPSTANTAFFGGGPTTEPPEKREYTNRTVRELLDLYDGKTAFQADKLMEPYKGMWIETDGKIIGLYPDGQGAATAALRNDTNPIECRFPADQSRALGRYNNGDSLKVRGKISTTQNGQQLYLLYCEVVSK